MSKAQLVAAMISVVMLAPAAFALNTMGTVAESRKLAEQKKYGAALELLKKALAESPEDGELMLARIRVLDWAGKYREAEAALNALPQAQQTNPDAMLLRGSVAYHQGHFATAEKHYAAILTQHPDYQDARDGLLRAQKATRAARVAAAKPAAAQEAFLPWQVDTGLELSQFSRRSQTNWNQEFLQLTHFLDARKTALHGKLTRYDQFNARDAEVELGADHQFSPTVNGYAALSLVSHANFRPRNRVAGGGAMRVMDSTTPLWATIDARYDTYADTRVLNLNPGLKLDVADGWSVAGRRIIVDQSSERKAYGWDGRLDGTVTDGLRFYAGYASAPDTVAGVTVDTTTWFGGAAYDVTPVNTLRVGYARDDRQNSYIRDIYNASISYRF
jgi:YaiO family outer membrane protein